MCIKIWYRSHLNKISLRTRLLRVNFTKNCQNRGANMVGTTVYDMNPSEKIDFTRWKP